MDRIEIEGFRDRAAPLILNFDEKVNFIIGRNGSGKTSLINLINAALSGDSVRLKAAPFSKLSIRLKAAGSAKRPLIRYYKAIDSEGSVTLSCAIQQKTSESPVFELVEDPDDPWSTSYRLAILGSAKWMRKHSPIQSSLYERISQFVVTTWLSVHRSSDPRDNDPERKFESPVDQRLHHVFRKFGVLFSTLDNRSAALTDKFQTNYFLSLISPPKVNAFSGEASKIDADAEKQALREMFSEFGLTRSLYSSKLDAFAKQVTRAVNWQKVQKGEGLPSDYFLTLTDALRIDSLVKEWADLLNERGEIYSSKTDFIKILNSLLYKKELSINPGNQPVFSNDIGDVISPDDLSSGEKQRQLYTLVSSDSVVCRGLRCQRRC